MKKFFDNRKAFKIICFTLAMVISLGIYNIVKAESPNEWEKYVNSSGINSTIYNYSKLQMDKYSGSGSYTLVPTSEDIEGFKAHGEDNLYTNLTIDGEKKLKSKWFLSGYGPFLYYAQNNSPEETSIKFSEENNLFDNADHVYVSHSSADLGDSKSLGIYYYGKGSNDLPPLLINSSSSSLSSTVVNKVKEHNKKNIVVLGGSQRYNTMFAIGEQFNVVRIGGADRNQTYAYLNYAEESSDKIYNVSSPPKLNADGYICDIKTDEIIPTDKKIIENYLKNYNFEAAAKLAIENYQYGAPVNAKYGDYEVLIGCKESATSDKMKFLKVYFLRESDGYQYGVYQYVGTDYEYDNNPGTEEPTEPTEPTEPDNIPPVAKLKVTPNRVKAGDEIYLDASDSYDEDGYIEHYDWETSITNGRHGSFWDKDDAKLWYEWLPEYEGLTEKEVKTKVIVTDDGGKKANTQKTYYILPPTIEATLNITGTLKENRKINLSLDIDNPEHYPIESIDWTVTASDTNADVSSLRHSGTLDGSANKDILFKKYGQYKISVTVKNTAGYTANASKTINIEKDLYPIVDIDGTDKILRDPTNNNLATFSLIDISKSIDNDYIAKRLWIYTYDSDNDGNFTDETTYFLLDGKWVSQGKNPTIPSDISNLSCGNIQNPLLQSKEVGKYDIRIVVQEGFGQATIEEFVTSADRHSAILD